MRRRGRAADRRAVPDVVQDDYQAYDDGYVEPDLDENARHSVPRDREL